MSSIFKQYGGSKRSNTDFLMKKIRKKTVIEISISNPVIELFTEKLVKNRFDYVSITDFRKFFSN